MNQSGILNIGRLNRRLDIYALNQTKDDTGGYISNWVFEVSTWGKVVEIRGNRALELDQTINNKPYEITIRRRPSTAVDGDFSSEDFDALDFFTNVNNNAINENYMILYRNQKLVMHSIINDDDRICKILAYSKR